MNPKRTIGGSVALAAMIGIWVAQQRQKCCRRAEAEQNRLTEQALQTLEGEGGVVLD